MRRHFVIVGILVIVMAILTYVGLDSAGLMPVEASTQAADIDWMWNLEVIAMSFLFALIVAPMIYSLVVFRRRKGDTTDGQHMEGAHQHAQQEQMAVQGQKGQHRNHVQQPR